MQMFVVLEICLAAQPSHSWIAPINEAQESGGHVPDHE